MSSLYDRGPHNPPPDSQRYSESEIKAFNQQHDQRYAWSHQFPALYENKPPGHVPGPPNLKELRKTLSEEELNKLIWQWHTP